MTKKQVPPTEAPEKDLNPSTPDYILGTAGHIDHGKSSLIQALTGTDPDRLIEEKKRGITIELGFAELVLPDGTRMGVVDVPGHERFVRQMISGATGIDLALLCIAADDGVMPQTKEHVAVLELLGISNAVVALTKCDLVEDDWLALAKDDVERYLQTTKFAGCKIVPVSSKTGEGLDDLRQALKEAAQQTQKKKASDTFRLPVDRSFTIKGAGTVITGTLWGGTAHVGQELEILPSGTHTRIRSIQVHGLSVDKAAAGHRTALNLNNISTDEIRPGDMLIEPGTVRMSDRFDAELTYLGNVEGASPLNSGTRVHVSHGTKEVVGRVLLMNEASQLQPHSVSVVQIRLDEDLPVSYGDRFIIRSFSPVYVVGGGTVLRSHPRRTTNIDDNDKAQLHALRKGDTEGALTAAFMGSALPVSAEQLGKSAEASASEAQAVLNKLIAQGKAVVLPTGTGQNEWFISNDELGKIEQKIDLALLAFHKQHKELSGISKDALKAQVAPGYEQAAFDGLITRMNSEDKLLVSQGIVSHPTAGAGAKQLEIQAAEKVLSAVSKGKQTPPLTSELPQITGLSQKIVNHALTQLEKNGSITKISKDFFISSECLTGLKIAVSKYLQDGGATAAQLKTVMQTSRKYAIPLLEYFDQQGITRREGDVRVLNSH